MGKIFKALEKAEKQNVAKPVQRSQPERLKPESEAAASPARNEPAAPLVKRPVERRVESVKEASRQPTEAPLPSAPRPAPPVVEPPPPSAPSKPIVNPDGAQKVDGVGITLLKPDSNGTPHPVQENADPEPIKPRSASVARFGPAKEVQVHYSRTRVQINDPEKLRNNKIFSIHDNLETTDQIKILRTQVLRKLKEIGGNSILITSANPYEGKTFTSINLGVSIAKEFDRTVLLIDADIRRPTKQHTSFSTEFFSLKVEKGLTDYLIGDADISDILINPGIDKLTLIPGGVPVNNSPELLNSGRMAEMMQEIKSRYPADRVVIVDGPAILPFSDAMILSRYVDGVLPVVEVERTPADQLKKMMELLKETRVLGTVMNKSKA